MARHRFWLVGLAVVAVAAILVVPGLLVASDHDDGETDTKGRNVNLTDLYAFREGDQTGDASQNSNLILVMNTNPRSVARQQYYFSARTRYEFRIERAASNSAAPAAAGLSRPDIILRFEFGEPAANKQSMKVTAIRDGVRMVATGAVTSPLPVPAADAPTIHGVMLGVSRLAGTASNEGLVITTDCLNRLNPVGPDCEAKALAGQQPCAGILGPVFTEVIGTLAALGNNSTRIGQLVAAFLPDVMRIDTTQASGYAAGFTDLNGPATLTRGRKLTDDVIDATLFVLTSGAVTSDGVSYDGPNLDGRGHKTLLTTFPYLATPN